MKRRRPTRLPNKALAERRHQLVDFFDQADTWIYTDAQLARWLNDRRIGALGGGKWQLVQVSRLREKFRDELSIRSKTAWKRRLARFEAFQDDLSAHLGRLLQDPENIAIISAAARAALTVADWTDAILTAASADTEYPEKIVPLLARPEKKHEFIAACRRLHHLLEALGARGDFETKGKTFARIELERSAEAAKILDTPSQTLLPTLRLVEQSE